MVKFILFKSFDLNSHKSEITWVKASVIKNTPLERCASLYDLYASLTGIVLNRNCARTDYEYPANSSVRISSSMIPPLFSIALIAVTS